MYTQIFVDNFFPAALVIQQNMLYVFSHGAWSWCASMVMHMLIRRFPLINYAGLRGKLQGSTLCARLKRLSNANRFREVVDYSTLDDDGKMK